MSKLHRLWDETKALEREGLVEVVDGVMTIVRDEEAVRDRIMLTGPWGGFEDAFKEIHGGHGADDQT